MSSGGRLMGTEEAEGDERSFRVRTAYPGTMLFSSETPPSIGIPDSRNFFREFPRAPPASRTPSPGRLPSRYPFRAGAVLVVWAGSLHAGSVIVGDGGVENTNSLMIGSAYLESESLGGHHEQVLASLCGQRWGTMARVLEP
jgi:hypothetical protein